ncbi:unnamed protein product, partial [Rhizoctonia solani]
MRGRFNFSAKCQRSICKSRMLAVLQPRHRRQSSSRSRLLPPLDYICTMKFFTIVAVLATVALPALASPKYHPPKPCTSPTPTPTPKCLADGTPCDVTNPALDSPLGLVRLLNEGIDPDCYCVCFRCPNIISTTSSKDSVVAKSLDDSRSL